MRKKILALLLAAAMITVLPGCGRTKPDGTTAVPSPETTAPVSTAAPETKAETTAPESMETAPESTGSPESTAAPESTETAPESTEEPSAPGTTEEPAVPESTEAPGLESLDYSLPENWAYYAVGDNKPVDVFLICPTVDTRSERNALDLNEKLKGRFVNALDMEKGIYEGTARMFSPYYRQMSINVYTLPADEREAARRIAYEDVADAFRWYLDHENHERGLILAGFSQGAEMCLDLLKEFYGGDSAEAVKLRANLVTVYAIGWHVTEEMTKEYPQIVPAAGERDTGSVVCFDCEDGTLSGTIIIPEGVTTRSINPLNWLTDKTPADKSLNLGAVMSTGAEPQPGLCGAYIGGRGELVVTDVTPADYPPGLAIFPEGAYHLYDYMFFFENLRQNIQDRTDKWLRVCPG